MEPVTVKRDDSDDSLFAHCAYLSTIGPLPNEISANFTYREEAVASMMESDDVMVAHQNGADEVRLEAATEFHHLDGQILGRRYKTGAGDNLRMIPGKGRSKKVKTLLETMRGIMQSKQQTLLWMVTSRRHPPMQGTL